jgi:hypothetical protein
MLTYLADQGPLAHFPSAMASFSSPYELTSIMLLQKHKGISLAQIGVLFEMGECKGSYTKEPSLTYKPARYCGTDTLVPMDKVDLQMAINKQWT